MTACVTSYRRVSASGFQIVPARAFTTKFRRFAPNRSSRYFSNVWMYSCPIGICFSKPADIRSWTAKTAITAVNAAMTPRVWRRWPKKNASAFCTSRPSTDRFTLSSPSRNYHGKRAGSGNRRRPGPPSEVAGQERADEIPVGQRLPEVVRPAAVVVREVDPRVPLGGRVLVEQDVEVDRLGPLQVVRGQGRRVALE